MGTFDWPLRISGLNGGPSREIEATVDTGAAYTTLPARLLRELGIEPMGQRRFLLADGRRVDMDYGQAWIAIDGERVVTVVVFGEDDAPSLLGAYTLEGLALAVDPVEQRLVPHISSCTSIHTYAPGAASLEPGTGYQVRVYVKSGYTTTPPAWERTATTK